MRQRTGAHDIRTQDPLPLKSLLVLLVLLAVSWASLAEAQALPDSGERTTPRGRAFPKWVRMRGDMLRYDLLPSVNSTWKGASFRTNRWGMRDKDYTLKRPQGVYRIALVGSSLSLGGGVPQEQTFEALMEDRLNREEPASSRRRFEILNFSVLAYGILQNVAVTEKRIFPFQPNSVLLMIHSNEEIRMEEYLVSLLKEGIPIEYPYVREKLQQAGVKPGMQEPELRRRLTSVSRDLVKWSYLRIAQLCKEHGVPVVGVAFPQARPITDNELETVAGWAAAAGIPVLSLQGVYDGHPFNAVRLKGDPHLNQLGHQLVANRLYLLLRQNDARALHLGFPGPK
jgi:hypothetical protein